MSFKVEDKNILKGLKAGDRVVISYTVVRLGSHRVIGQECMLPGVECHNGNSGPDTHARIRRMTLDIAPGGWTLKEEHHG